MVLVVVVVVVVLVVVGVMIMVVRLSKVPAYTTVTATDLVMMLLPLLSLFLSPSLSSLLHVYVDGDILLSVPVDQDVDIVDVDPHVILGGVRQLVYSLLGSQRRGWVGSSNSPWTLVDGLNLSGGVNMQATALTRRVIILDIGV